MKIFSFLAQALVVGALLIAAAPPASADSHQRRDYRSDDNDGRRYDRQYDRRDRHGERRHRERYSNQDYHKPPPWARGHRRDVRHKHRHAHHDRRGRVYTHRHGHVHDRFHQVRHRRAHDGHDHRRGERRYERDYRVRRDQYVEPAPAPSRYDIVDLPEAGLGHCNREIVGAVLGGATGAVVGSQLGKGDGKTVATIGGAIVGLLVGGNIGRSMDRIDHNCVGQVLETAPTGRTVEWQNPDQRGKYWITPVRTYQAENGQYCREYTTKVIINGRPQDAFGKACRQEDGSWKKSL